MALPIAAGAPLGWLALAYLLRPDGEVTAHWLRREVVEHVALYVYLELSTSVVLSSLGWTLGGLVDRLAQDAHTDSLTGLVNRRALEARLVEEMARAKRYGTQLVLVVVDVDDFKAINDERGHDGGDATLTRLARCLRGVARESDVVARPAGDEFVLLLPHTERSAAVAVCERLRESAAVAVPGLTVTLGGAVYRPELHHTPRAFFHDADQALYAAKQAGKNCVRFAAGDEPPLPAFK